MSIVLTVRYPLYEGRVMKENSEHVGFYTTGSVSGSRERLGDGIKPHASIVHMLEISPSDATSTPSSTPFFVRKRT